MKNIDPATWTQLIVALATFLTAMAGVLKSISNGKKADINAQKIDVNTALTKETHEATVKAVTAVADVKNQVEKQTAVDAARNEK